MDAPGFTEFAKAMIDYITDYLENIRDRRVLPTVEPGYIKPLLPDEAPQTPERWEDVMADIERVIMPGVTHWGSPKFHAYFPTAQSYPAIVADMLSGAIACIGFTWIASPACTELEVVMLDWLGKMIDLPAEFLACSGGKGGGVIQGTASEATLVALLGAKVKKIKQVKEEHPGWSDPQIIDKLVAYGSSLRMALLDEDVDLGTVNVRVLVFADDLDAIAKSADELQILLNRLNASSKSVYLKINVNKTKIIVYERLGEKTVCNIALDGERIEQVDEFVYLGSLFTADGKIDREISIRIKEDSKIIGSVGAINRSKIVIIKAKIAIYNSVLAPTVFYGSETLT